jgi:hypothetical protein
MQYLLNLMLKDEIKKKNLNKTFSIH